MNSEAPIDQRPASKLAFLAIVVAVLAVVAHFALGMPGMDHTAATSVATGMPEMPGMAEMPSQRSMLIEATPTEFRTAIAGAAATVINVHVPYEGEIAGTDAFIPFDEIADSTALPDDLDAPILLYCRSGRMSRIAGEALGEFGYTDVTHLAGGMIAWEGEGLPLRDGG